MIVVKDVDQRDRISLATELNRVESFYGALTFAPSLSVKQYGYVLEGCRFAGNSNCLDSRARVGGTVQYIAFDKRH